jgi:hypothetical protein
MIMISRLVLVRARDDFLPRPPAAADAKHLLVTNSNSKKDKEEKLS